MIVYVREGVCSNGNLRQSAEGAITQIRKRNYAKRIGDYTGGILFVGINYDKTSKKHQCINQCIIEKHTKE